MRVLVLLGCAFALGWVLSWMYYDTSTDAANSGPVGATTRPSTSTATSPSTSVETNPPGQPRGANEAASPVSVFDVTADRLRRGEFEAVMADYPVIQRKLSENDSATYKKIIIDHAESLRKSGQPAFARALLTLYLRQEYRDVSALLVMARIYQDANDEMQALEVLFQAKSYAYTPELIERTDQAVRSLVRNYNAQLSARKDYIAQLNLYKRLTELEPEHTDHYIGLAETYLALGSGADARKALELTQHDSSVADQRSDIMRRIESQIKADRHYAAAVSMRTFGNQFLVDAVLNNARDAVLLLDTGASLSIISAELLAGLGMANQSTGKMAWFSTAGGRIKAPVVRLDSLALDGVVVENIEVGVIAEFDNNQFDGLLGMNFLRHFEFFIDQNENKLQLNPH